MKYTPRHIQRFISEGKIDADLWKARFPSLLPSQVPGCSGCTAYRERICSGGQDPVDCLLATCAARNTEEDGQGRKKKNRDPMLGLGMKGGKVHGTAKPRDQSKM